MIVNLESENVTWLATVIFWVVSVQQVPHESCGYQSDIHRVVCAD